MKIHGVLTKSDNAISAEIDGRYPLSQATRRLKSLAPTLTLAQCRAALEACWNGEWHHSSKFANEVRYYDVDATLDKINEDPTIVDRRQKKEKPADKTVQVTIEWREWRGSRAHGRYVNHDYQGEATVKGAWIHFVYLGSPHKKKIDGNNITIKYLDTEAATDRQLR